MQYHPEKTEKKWQQYWANNKTFKAEDSSDKPPFYVLDMFPYPSGAGLHVGHPLGYIASDIYARYKRLKGFNVLHPMGYDSFGLPAEQYAIQTGTHPAITTVANINTFRRQMDNIGFSFDWDREVRTSDPSYYKWTQWIFLKLFDSWYCRNADAARPISRLVEEFSKHGNKDVNAHCDETPLFTANEWNSWDEAKQQTILLNYRIAYLSEAYVNWCPQLGTVLANDEVKDGVSERGGYPVERKLMKQWSMRITAYSQRLLDGLEDIDWSESLKEQQRNWIGRSEGAMIRFHLSPGPSPEERGDYPDESGESSGGNSESPGYAFAEREVYGALKDNMKSMRKDPTPAEEALWQKLRRNSTGHHFRRQHVIGKYIADFVCLKRQLIVEVDGNIHDHSQEQDAARTANLEVLGFKVIRFTNHEVIHASEKVLAKIAEEASSRPDFSLQIPPSSGGGQGEVNSPLLGRGAGGEVIEVFTTRPDTIFGVSFMTLAPEHELVAQITTPEQKAEIEAYIAKAKARSDRERMADVKTVSGAFTGAYAEHPFTGKLIPIWIGDYVLAGYGTGAVMAVPSGDQRDWSFAKHFNLPIPQVIASPPGKEGSGEVEQDQANESKDGTLINSDFLNGMKVKDAIKATIAKLEEIGIGKGKINYRQRDAVFGRQRYWGEPIPVYYKDGVPYPVKEEHLPITLPEIDEYLPTETGEPPLARAKGWGYDPERGVVTDGKTPPSPPLSGGELRSSHPDKVGSLGELHSSTPGKEVSLEELHSSPPGKEGSGEVSIYPIELSTMPGWAGSSWYYLRYMDPKNDHEFCSKEAIDYWGNVNYYAGGAEHATGHLLYVRFWTKFLKDLGHLPFDEPAQRLVNQGMIQGVSEKMYMSKKEKSTSQYIGSLDRLEILSEPVVRYVSSNVIDEIRQRELSSKGKEEAEKWIEENFTKVNFPIQLVSNNKIDFNALVQSGLKNQFLGSLFDDGKTAAILTSSGKLDVVDGLPPISELSFVTVSEVEKMSKSKHNVVNPDDIIAKYGADTLRLYEMFLGPLEDAKPWNTNGIEGTYRFLRKFWNLFHEGDTFMVSGEKPTAKELKALHSTIRKVEEDIEKLSLNTSVSQFMICANELTELKCNKRAILEPLTIVLSSFAPHICEELWQLLGHSESITLASYPAFNESHLVEDSFSYPISFNGKVRMNIELPTTLSAAEVETIVVAHPEVIARLEGATPKKVIVVPKRIVNMVV